VQTSDSRSNPLDSKAENSWENRPEPTGKCQRTRDKLLDAWNKSHPLVSDLIGQHRECINRLKQLTSDVTNEQEHDDLWMLRFILSNGKVSGAGCAAEKAVRDTIVWRAKMKDKIDVIRAGKDLPMKRIVQEHMKVGSR